MGSPRASERRPEQSMKERKTREEGAIAELLVNLLGNGSQGTPFKYKKRTSERCNLAYKVRGKIFDL